MKFGKKGLYIQKSLYKFALDVKTVAIDIPGGNRSLVEMIIAQTTILKRAIKIYIWMKFKQEFIELYVSLLLATSSEHYEDI